VTICPDFFGTVPNIEGLPRGKFDGLIPIPNLLSSDAFFRAQNAPISIFGWGSAGGAYDAPQTSSRLRRGYPIFLHLDAFGASDSVQISIIDLWSP